MPRLKTISWNQHYFIVVAIFCDFLCVLFEGDFKKSPPPGGVATGRCFFNKKMSGPPKSGKWHIRWYGPRPAGTRRGRQPGPLPGRAHGRAHGAGGGLFRGAGVTGWRGPRPPATGRGAWGWSGTPEVSKTTVATDKSGPSWGGWGGGGSRQVEPLRSAGAYLGFVAIPIIHCQASASRSSGQSPEPRTDNCFVLVPSHPSGGGGCPTGSPSG